MRPLIVLLLLLYVVQRGISMENVSLSLENVKTRLVNSLFNDYNKLVEPSHADPKFGFRFLCAWRTSLGSPLVTSVVELYSWTDRRLTWDPQKFDNVQQLILTEDLIWKPDMVLLNNLEATVHRIPSNFLLKPDGNIVWFSKVNYKTFCTENPCQYNVGLWTYDDLNVPVTIWNNESPDMYYLKTCPLHIQSVQMVKRIYFFPCCATTPYSFLQYNVNYTSF